MVLGIGVYFAYGRRHSKLSAGSLTTASQQIVNPYQ
jgi:hypothetical protein